jgi:excisionase family DNA binding protein
MSGPQHSRERPAATPGRTPGRRRPCGEHAQAERSRSGHAARSAWQPMTAAPRRLTADDVMTAREVAELLHAPVSTVEDWARRDILPSVKIGKRRLYIRQNIEAVLIGPAGTAR